MFNFHKHLFVPSADPMILYCHCGQTKDLHRHEWENHSKITELNPAFKEGQRNIGWMMRCKVCGELKAFDLFE